MTKIDFGLIVRPAASEPPFSKLLEYNQRCIQALPPSFTTLWVEDHLQWGEEARLECFTTLCFLAGEFSNFHLGTVVLSQSYRNPALLAKMAATLQFLSQGRVILGIGAGWKEDEYSAYGYRFPNASERLEQLEEAILIIRSMWTTQPANFTGKHYQINNAYCQPQPSPAIPLLIGGGGERHTLRLVALYADWWNYNSCTVKEYAHKVSILRKHCADIGRDPSEIRLTYLSTVSVAEDPSQVVRHPQKHFIAGNSTEVIQELERFCEIGVSHFIVKFPDFTNLKHFIETVVPHFT